MAWGGGRGGEFALFLVFRVFSRGEGSGAVGLLRVIRSRFQLSVSLTS